MKGCVVLFLALFCATVAIADINDGLVAYYPLDGNANDASGNGHDGVEQGGLGYAAGVSGQAVVLDGIDDFVDVSAMAPSLLSIPGNTGSVSFWFKASIGQQGQDEVTPFVVVGADYVWIRIGDSTRYSDTESIIWGATGCMAFLGPELGHDYYIDDQWHHVVVLMGDDHNAMYINGVQVSGRYPWSTGGTPSTGGCMWPATIDQIEIGHSGGGTAHFEGSIDEVRIYNRALSAAEVSQLAGGQSTGLIAYYPLDGDAQDHSGNGHDGTVDGAIGTVDRNGNQESAMEFDGYDDYIDIPHAGDFMFDSSFSLAAWVRPDRVDYTDGGKIVCKSRTDNEWSLLFLNGEIVSFYEYGSDTDERLVATVPGAPVGAWHHVCSTYNATSGLHSLYWDGTLLAQQPAPAPQITFTGSVGIGAEADSQIRFFDGAIDEVRIYNRALTEQEVQDLYGGGAPIPITYVALGDSYSSGEGAGRYRIDLNGDSDTNDLWNGVLWEDTDWWNSDSDMNLCHRSAYSWSSDRPGNEPDTAVPSALTNISRLNVACSGAVIDDLYVPYHQNHEGKNPDEIAQADHPALFGADMVSITIGGNDVGFPTLVKKCAFVFNCADPNYRPEFVLPYQSLSEWVEARISSLANGELFNAYWVLKGGSTINRPTFVMGYPQVISNPIFQIPGFPGICDVLNTAFSTSELDAFDQWTNTLNTAISCAASEAGVHHIGVSFEGHEACGIWRDWIWTINVGISDLLNIQESFHPNKRGQQAFADKLNDFIDIFPTPPDIPENPIPTDPANLPWWCDDLKARAPKTDLPSLDELDVAPPVLPGCSEQLSFVPGQSIEIHGGGFSPNVSVEVTMHELGAPAAQTVGTIQTDSIGNLQGSVVIPVAFSTPNNVLVEALGDGSNGFNRLLIAPIELVGSMSSDSDSDGIVDACDNCLDEANGDQLDSDSDGTGDVCDPCPLDDENDWDGDGLCADVDPCPLDPTNTIDIDGACFNVNGIFTDGFESGDTSAWSGVTP